jgi:hypothetical protein
MGYNMSKMPLAWHEKSLENWGRSISAQRDRLRQSREAFEATERQYNFYALQIATAKQTNKQGFDENLFLARQRP